MSDARVHPDARGFDQSADAYERGRPTYPRAAVDWLATRLRIGRGSRVLDLAAGTGKFTRELVARGADVVAVEPAPGMRERLRAELPEVEVLDGTAEAIPLADGSADAVTVAQAFHWFRPDETFPELHRVLRDGGGLGLVWNSRDERDPIHAEAVALLEPLRGDAPWWRTLDASDLLRSSPLFRGVEKAEFPHRQEVDADGFVTRFLSVSFVASAAPDVRARVERELRRIAARQDEPIVLPYVTETYVCFRAGQPTTE